MSFDPFNPDHAQALPADLPEALAWSRAARGRFGEPLFYALETPSTNDVAARLAEAGASEGTTVVAESQTAGRGRQGRSWASPPGGGLYVSTILRPDPVGPMAASPSALTLMAGVALAEAVRASTGLAVDIKWPNDLMVERRKLAGILAEGSAVGASIEYVVLGFGINIRAAAYPPDVAARATSLEHELGRPVDRGAVLAHALIGLANGVAELARGELRAILDRWRRLAPAAVGAPIEWRVGERVRRGVTAGLDADGALLVSANGTTERVAAGEIIWL